MKNIVIGMAGAAVLLLLIQSDGGESDQSGGLDGMINDFTEPDGTMTPNVQAFLKMIRAGEGTAGGMGYQTKMGGDTFTDMSDHPANLGWRGTPLSDTVCAAAGRGAGCVSTAAGAYQFIKPTWNALAKKLGLPDFSPASQDAAAIELIRQRGALSYINAGDIQTAISKCATVWASFAGAGYGQREVALGGMMANYTNAGGVL